MWGDFSRSLLFMSSSIDISSEVLPPGSGVGAPKVAPRKRPAIQRVVAVTEGGGDDIIERQSATLCDFAKKVPRSDGERGYAFPHSLGLPNIVARSLE